MSNLIPFDFNGKKVTVVTDDNGAPWFVAMEIASILGYSDAEAMTRRLDEDEKQNLRMVGFGPRGVTVISEAGLYASILASQKAEAKPFKRWVTHDVLPSIRRTGSYVEQSPRANERALARNDTSAAYRVMTDMVVEVREEVGKSCKSHHFSNEALMLNEIIFGVRKAVDRDSLGLNDLATLTKMEIRNARLIGRGLSYAERKDMLRQYHEQLLLTPLPKVKPPKGRRDLLGGAQ
jgi:prophage antirepressor-like protein